MEAWTAGVLGLVAGPLLLSAIAWVVLKIIKWNVARKNDRRREDRVD